MSDLSDIVKLVNTDSRKILSHKEELKGYLQGKPHGLVAMEVDLSLACNHKCPECTFGDYLQKMFLPDSVMEKILESIPSLGVKGMILTGGGEPCTHKRLGEFVKRVNQLGVSTTLTTNGQLINRHFEDLMRNLTRMRFSMDAAKVESHGKTHGMKPKDFEKTIVNMKEAVFYKKKNSLPIDLGISFLINGDNAGELEYAVDFYSGIGVDFLHFKPMQFWNNETEKYYYENYPEVNQFLAKIDQFQSPTFRVSLSREKHFDETKDFSVPYNTCHGAHFDLIVGADARCYTCCHFKYNPKFGFGDLNTDSFQEVIAQFKSSVQKECFANCKMDAINQLIQGGKGDPDQLINLATHYPKGTVPLNDRWI